MKKNKPSLDAGTVHYLRILGIVLAAILFYAILNNLSGVGSGISFLLNVLAPITIGLCIAFVLNIPLKFFEQIVFKKLTNKNGKIWSKLKRPLCLTLSVLSFVTIITVVLSFIIPQIVSTSMNFFLSLPEKMSEINAFIKDFVTRYHLPMDTSSIHIDWDWVSAQAISYLSKDHASATDGALSIAIGIFNSVFDTLLGFVFSIYILASKESLGKLAKSFLYSIINKEKAKSVISVAVLSNKAFTGFVAGQCIEVTLIGILCFVGMLILRFEYPIALMISFIIAVTAFVPIFGAIAGAIIGAILILISESFFKAVIFLIFILVLQQIESNVIYPRIMGKQVGLPGVWVLTAVTIGGGLFGVLGIILSVPLCSVAYTLSQKWMIRRLEARNICHRSMSHDSSEPKDLVETINDYEFEPEYDIGNSEATESVQEEQTEEAPKSSAEDTSSTENKPE